MKFFSWHLDFVGFWASLLCAIHCALMPVVLTLSVSVGASWLANPILEWTFISISIAIASWALLRSYFTKHQNVQPVLIAGIGFASLIISQKVFVSNAHILMATGGTLIAYAHYLNWRLAHPITAQRVVSRSWFSLGKMVMAILLLLYFLGLKSACVHNTIPPTKAEILQVVWRAQE